MALLGVIVPIYNTDKFLSACIESILNQTFQDFKLILVDDGSTDQSGTICDDYAAKDARISVIHQSNQGPVAARYNGIKLAETDYITFVDSDDWIKESCYETLLPYMKEGIDVISYGIMRYYDEKNIIYSPEKLEDRIYKKADLEKKLYPDMIWNADTMSAGYDPALWNKIYKRKYILEESECAQELTFQYGEDVAVIYPLLTKINTLAVTHEYFYFHRKFRGAQMGNYVKDSGYMDSLYHLYKYLTKRLGDDKNYRKQLEYFYFHAIQVRLAIYGDRIPLKGYAFPFEKVPKGSRVVLYGAGSMGHAFHRQIKYYDYHNLAAWVDKNNKDYPPDKVQSIESIENFEYDYIVIAIESKSICQAVKEELITRNVPEHKIVLGCKG